jgi:hypothetical protein
MQELSMCGAFDRGIISFPLCNIYNARPEYYIGPSKKMKKSLLLCIHGYYVDGDRSNVSRENSLQYDAR